MVCFTAVRFTHCLHTPLHWQRQGNVRFSKQQILRYKSSGMWWDWHAFKGTCCPMFKKQKSKSRMWSQNKILQDYIIRILCENGSKNNDMNFMISVCTDWCLFGHKKWYCKDDVEGVPSVGNKDHGREQQIFSWP